MRSSTHATVLLSVVVSLLVGCRPYIPEAPRIDPAGMTEDQKTSIESVRKLSDGPVFSMTLTGAYDERLRKNIRSVLKIGATDPRGCSAFAFSDRDGSAVFGRNHDYFDSPVLILYTSPPDGYRSVSLVDLSLLRFDSKTADRIVENELDRALLLYAPFLPLDGMNEWGLAVGTMYTERAEYDGNPEKPEIFSLEAIRMLLDYARTTEEAIRLLEDCNIAFPVLPSHFLIADAEGDAALVEFIGGKLSVIRTPEGSIAATNFQVTDSERVLSEKREEYGRNGSILRDINGKSYWRFCRAEYLLSSSPRTGIKKAMDILREIRLPEAKNDVWMTTEWSVAYDLSRKTAMLAAQMDYDHPIHFGPVTHIVTDGGQ